MGMFEGTYTHPNPDGTYYDERVPHCPICGAEAYDGFYDRTGTIIGCDQCVTKKSWEDCPEMEMR